MNCPTKNSLNQITELDEFYQQLWDGTPDAVLLVDDQGKIILSNEKVEKIFGYSADDVIGEAIEKLIPSRFCKHQDHFSGFMKFPHKRETLTVSGLIGLKKDGNEFHADISLRPIANSENKMVFTYVRDMTDRLTVEEENKQLQEQLFQSQKIAALGQLTGGIAHDFNNILAAIDGYTQLSLSALSKDGKTADDLEGYISEIHSACSQGSELIKQMMAFSRKGKPHEQVLMPWPLVKDTLKMLYATLPSSIETEVSFANDLPRISFDPVQFQQVITNLCINARDAMGGIGRLEVSLSSTDLAGACCSSCGVMFSGEFVEIKINDSGCGISQETMEQMFKSLFTTKDVDKGTGMGLAVVHGIVHQHGGHVLVESSPGEGATFRLLLPPHVEVGDTVEAE